MAQLLLGAMGGGSQGGGFGSGTAINQLYSQLMQQQNQQRQRQIMQLMRPTHHQATAGQPTSTTTSPATNQSNANPPSDNAPITGSQDWQNPSQEIPSFSDTGFGNV